MMKMTVNNNSNNFGQRTEDTLNILQCAIDVAAPNNRSSPTNQNTPIALSGLPFQLPHITRQCFSACHKDDVFEPIPLSSMVDCMEPQLEKLLADTLPCLITDGLNTTNSNRSLGHQPTDDNTITSAIFDDEQNVSNHQSPNPSVSQQSWVPLPPSSTPGHEMNRNQIDAGSGSTQSGIYPSMKLPDFARYKAGAWNERLKDLLVFYEENGHVAVPNVYPENQKLAQWVKRQRYQYRLKKAGRHSTLSNDREEVLNRIGFVWDSHTSTWNDSFQALKCFARVHGHTSVGKLHCNPTLATWCKHQRREYRQLLKGKSSRLTPERVQALSSIGFQWNPRNLSR